MAHPKAIQDPNSASSGWLVPGPVAMGVAAASVTTAFVFAFWDFFEVQYHFAMAQPADWGHTLFIPLIALYIVGLHRSDLLERPFKTGYSGLLMILFGLMLYSITTVGPDSTILNSHNARSIGFGVTLLGICVTLLGWRSILWVWFPLLYLVVFGQKITDKVLILVTYPLQDAAAFLGWIILDLLGYQVSRLGTTINVMNADGSVYPLDVAEACSGMRMLMAFLALGTVIAYVGLDKWWLRIILILIGIPIAIIINAFRIATLGILSLHDQDYMVGQFHSFVGLVWMIPTFALYMLMLWFLQPLSENEDGSSRGGVGSSEHREVHPPRFDRKILGATISVIVVLIIGGTGLRAAMDALDRHLIKEAVPPRFALTSLPGAIGRWKMVGEDAEYSDTLIEVLGTNRYLDRNYAIDGDPSKGLIHLHLAYYTDLAGATPHVPERCWEVHGGTQVVRPKNIALDIDTSEWRETDMMHRAVDKPYFVVDVLNPLTGEVEEIPMPIGKIFLRTTQFTNNEQPDLHRLGGYLFLANGRVTPSASSVENLAFDLTSRHAYYCKLQIDMRGLVYDDGTELRGRYQQLSSEFLQELLPHLMRIMPDWRTYEGLRRGDEPTEAR
ncbi:MAG: exosortase/archaeosortase family protein [Phycisphaerales bacterium]|nr:exosortase/archaeosortase family protein [Phycisphaerales bacterium]